MSGLVDSEAVLAEFEDFLVADGRTSHGTDFLTRKLAELRARHRIDESGDAAVLRRFSGHLVDTFLGVLPRPTATTDPLTAADPQTATAMDAGAAPDQQTEGAAPCWSPPRTQGSSPAATPAPPRPLSAAATS